MASVPNSTFIRELKNGGVIVDRGPMLMSIMAFGAEEPSPFAAKRGAEKALEILDIMAVHRDILVRKVGEADGSACFPPVIKKMIEAAKRFGDPTITPLIAVAGASADEVANFVFGIDGVEKVIINNGGDVAIRLRSQLKARVGVKSDVTDRGISHVLTIKGNSGIGGIATSGFGGRSLTRGVADAAVAVARTSLLADIAATLIGNATDVQSPAIERARAKDIYPATDIPDLEVTKNVGDLTGREIDVALKSGADKAAEFESRGLIIGSFLSLKATCIFSESLRPIIRDVRDVMAVGQDMK